MAPNGSLYFPDNLFANDFAAPGVTLRRRALLVHEGTHLYQYYGLNWDVVARRVFTTGFNSRYSYKLQHGKKLIEYGLEQMGMIAQHYYTLREGGTLERPYDQYAMSDYLNMLPLEKIDATAGLRT
jgi:hypothetical protein